MNLKAGNALIAQGGGPTPVINNSVYGVFHELRRNLGEGSRIWGSQQGISGLFENKLFDLSTVAEDSWAAIARSPGAILRSCRRQLDWEAAETAVQTLQKKEIRYFFYVGGNDSMDTALKISRAAHDMNYDLMVAGVPKTIDNDLPETDHCPGYGSAARFIIQSFIDLGNDVYSLPTPISIMEVMGRNSGWLTAASMLARMRPDDAPHLIYLPEVPFSVESFLTDIQKVVDGQGWAVAAVCEGLKDKEGTPIGIQKESRARDGFGHPMQGDVSATLAAAVRSRTGLRARSEKPGLLGRASSLLRSSVDAREARAVGKKAACRTLAGETGFMVSIQRVSEDPYEVEYGAVALSEVANVERLLPAKFITGEKNNIRDEFSNYVKPLIGGKLERYPRLVD